MDWKLLNIVGTFLIEGVVRIRLFSAYHDTIPELSQIIIYAYGHPTFLHYIRVFLRHTQHQFLGQQSNTYHPSSEDGASAKQLKRLS